jgi:carbon-monoxide dehydrogenase large subunit
MDYGIPHTRMIRHFDMEMDESTPSINNPMGVKGVGELGTIGATPAVVNAVVDALARAGYERSALALQMPLTAERVWRAMQQRA